MEIFERPGWVHPSPLVNPADELARFNQKIVEEISGQSDGQPIDGQPIDGQPIDGQPIDGQPAE